MANEVSIRLETPHLIADSVSRRRSLTRTWWFLLLAFVLVEVHASGTFFREPLTGRKVEGYTLTLTLGRDGERQFTIPADCRELLEQAARGASQWGAQMQKSHWWKAESDCRYYTFLHRYGPGKMQHDFVRDYDFQNANLADLPISDPCSVKSLPSRACPNHGLGTGDMVQILALSDEPKSEEGWSREACALHQGTFRGQVRIEGSEVLCKDDPSGPGVRLVGVDYADVNGDGFQDAILRFSPLGRRQGRVPAVLPVCRKGAEEAFVIPRHETEE